MREFLSFNQLDIDIDTAERLATDNDDRIYVSAGKLRTLSIQCFANSSNNKRIH